MDGEVLEVTLVKGWDLIDGQSWEWGMEDPYATLNHNGQSFKTRVIEDGGRTVVWNETFTFYIGESDPDVTIRVFHDNWGKDSFLGATSIPWVSAVDDGYANPSLPLFTDCGEQRGYVEVVLKIPTVIARIEAEMDAEALQARLAALRLSQAKAEYEQALADATRRRMEKAKRELADQFEVLDTTLDEVSGADGYAGHESTVLEAKDGFVATVSESFDHLLEHIDFDTGCLNEKFKDDIEDDEDFTPQIENFIGAVDAAKSERLDAVQEAKATLEAALADVVGRYVEQLEEIKGRFKAKASASAGRYRSEVGSKIYDIQSEKAKEDVAELVTW